MGARGRITRQAVIDAAAGIADAEGLDAVRPARVAEVLGVRTPSLYNHVEGGDDVREALALRGLRDLLAAYRDAAVGRAGADALGAACHAARAYAHTHPGLYAAAQRAAPHPPQGERAEVEAETLDVLLAVLRGFELEGEEALHAVRAVRSALHGFISLELGGGFGYPLDLDVSFERLLAIVLSGLPAASAQVVPAG